MKRTQYIINPLNFGLPVYICEDYNYVSLENFEGYENFIIANIHLLGKGENRWKLKHTISKLALNKRT